MDDDPCLASTCGHFLLLKAFDMAEASVLQSFAYIGVATSAVVGFPFFADPVTAAMLTVGGIVNAARPFTFWASVCRPAPPRMIPADQLPWPAGRGIDTATVIQQLSNSPPFTSSTAQLKYSTLPRLVSMKTSKLTRSPSPGTGTMRWLA